MGGEGQRDSVFVIDFSNFLLYIYIYIYIYIHIYIFFLFFLVCSVFCLVGKYEVKACRTREFRGERHNQGWREGLTSTTRDGIFWGG